MSAVISLWSRGLLWKSDPKSLTSEWGAFPIYPDI